jgi:hypothetical protein
MDETARRARPRPHVVWFICDQLRADALGFAGNPVVRTPNLDRLAPALRGEPFARRASVYVQSIHCRDGGPFSNCLTVHTAGAKLNCYPGDGVAHPFDLLEDPAERRDLYADPGTSQLREAMISLLIERLHGQRDPLPTPLSQF